MIGIQTLTSVLSTQKVFGVILWVHDDDVCSLINMRNYEEEAYDTCGNEVEDPTRTIALEMCRSGIESCLTDLYRFAPFASTTSAKTRVLEIYR